MVEATPSVVADGLSRRFGTTRAVRSVSFTLASGSVLLLVGANGSGKTTLLRLLATALRPTSGSARVFGRDVVREAGAVRQITAFVGTSSGLYGGLSAVENLEFAAAMSGIRSPGITMLKTVGLDHAARRPVRTFSQGMKRRLALARAWMRAPRLLLMDEPFNGLDADGLHIVEDLVRSVKSREGMVIIATHDLERGLIFADSVMTLTDGRATLPLPSDQFRTLRQDVPIEIGLTGARR